MKDGAKNNLGIKIFQNCRMELYGYFPYLDGAFASVSYEGTEETNTAGTNGNIFYFCPEFLLKMYADCPAVVRRGYLHMLFHCMYLHLFAEKQPENWNLACDMAVELMIERIAEKRKIKGLQLPEEYDGEVRKECFRIMGEKSLSAEKLCEMIEEGVFSYKTEELTEAFGFDDHDLWKKGYTGAEFLKTRKKWKHILTYTTRNKSGGQKKAGTKMDNAREELEEIQKSKYDYRKFLKQFSYPREEVELDPESFDYIFYHFGMEHYGNLPLIEPLEYREVNRLEELVIAIDTSGSCSRETVQKFLGETYAILSEKENFFQKMKVLLVQCDCFLQSAVMIHSKEEWEAYSREIVIQGRGGTDFRSVFRYVEELKERGEMKNLRALIYFTDGDGIYPQMKPDYETAFVFLKKTEKMNLVPGWALRLVTG